MSIRRTFQPMQTAENGNGRGPGGRFQPGNKFALGNSVPRRVAKIREQFLKTVTLADVEAVTARIVKQAKAGDHWACRLLLQYLLGEPISVDVHAKIAAMEQTVSQFLEQEQ